MLLGTAVRPVPARMPYISRLCDVGATDVNADDDDDGVPQRIYASEWVRTKYTCT